jgi:hypothetical protein
LVTNWVQGSKVFPKKTLAERHSNTSVKRGLWT